MKSQTRTSQFRLLGLLIIALVFVLACRTTDLVQRYAANYQTDQAADAIGEASPSVESLAVATPTANLVPVSPSPTLIQVAGLVPAQRPTFTPTPVLFPGVAPSFRSSAPSQFAPARAPVRAPAKAATPTPAKISVPPTPRFEYQVSFSWCGPNWQTFVEGTVTQGGLPKNGLLVRISLDPDGSPTWSDYKTGTDPTKPGGYTQIIDANAPHDGLWRLWVVDPQTNQRISEIANVKTDPKRVAETSCQSATVNFSN